MEEVEKNIVPKIEKQRRETEPGLVEMGGERKSEEVLLEEAKEKDSEVKKVLVEKVEEGEREKEVVGSRKMLWVFLSVFVVALVAGLVGVLMLRGKGIDVGKIEKADKQQNMVSMGLVDKESEQVGARVGDTDEVTVDTENQIAYEVEAEEAGSIWGDGEDLVKLGYLEDGGYRLDLDGLSGLEGNPLAYLKAVTEEELVAEYEAIRQNGGCAGSCGGYLENMDRIGEEIEIVEALSGKSECELTPEEKSLLTNRFRLFAKGIETKHMVVGMRFGQLKTCGFRYLANDGYEVDMRNFMYKAGLFVDGKLVEVDLPLMERGVFSEVDEIYEELGFQGDACSGDCWNAFVDYFETGIWEDGRIDEVVRNFSEIVGNLRRI